jgi:hypothetical protein
VTSCGLLKEERKREGGMERSCASLMACACHECLPADGGTYRESVGDTEYSQSLPAQLDLVSNFIYLFVHLYLYTSGLQTTLS